MKKTLLYLGLILSLAGLMFAFFYFKPSEKSIDISVMDIKKDPEKLPEPAVIGPAKATFDIVRVEEGGSMVIAGRAKPSSEIILMDGQIVLANITSDQQGEWIYVPNTPLSSGAHDLWLRESLDDSQEKSEVVVVNVPESAKQDETVAVLLSSDGGQARILQAPKGSFGKVESLIEIHSALYAQGILTIKGSVKKESKVYVYADNSLLGIVNATTGEWSLRTVRPIKTGQKYLIRADKMDNKGRIVARVEVPFTVEDGADLTKKRNIRIVKGDNLWTIAKQLYGTGFAYITIYKANKHQIKNPDLIYPNQVFSLPKKTEN